jgi:hypothetical protein
MTNQPNDYDNDDYDLDDDNEPPAPPEKAKKPNWRRELEKDAAEGKTAAAERDAAKRELAFIKAGIDLDTPTGKLFAKAYDGANDVEAVTAAAKEYGVINTSQAPPALDQSIADEISAMDQVSGLGAGAATTSEESLVMGNLHNATSEAEVMQLMRDNGIPISEEQAGNWVSLV